MVCMALSARNQLRGQVKDVKLGTVMAHIVVQVARHEGRRVFGFVRPGDDAAAAFALELGCEWAGPSDEPGPEELDAAIIFGPQKGARPEDIPVLTQRLSSLGLPRGSRTGAAGGLGARLAWLGACRGNAWLVEILTQGIDNALRV